MASSQVSIYANGQHVRTYGGNRSDVRWMASCYRQFTVEQFNQKHPSYRIEEIQELEVYTKFNKS